MSPLPLEGIRILELTVIYAGPYASLILGDWGAEVIRVESIQVMQPSTRGQMAHPSKELVLQNRGMYVQAYPNWDPGERPWNRYANTNCVCRNKLSMTVDLRRPEGKEIFARLIRNSDVFIENNVPETIEKLGLTYDKVREMNPQIIMIRMPAFGLDGPYKNYRSLGLHVDGVTGHTWLRGYTDSDPSERGDTVAPDATAGAGAAFAVLAAIWYRKRTGKGQLIELNLAENFVPLLADSIMDYNINGRAQETLGNRDHAMAPHGCYPCRGEDRWLNIAVASDEEWQGLCQVMGLPELAQDSRFADSLSRWKHQDEMESIISSWTSEQDHLEAFHLLQAHGVAAAPLLDQKELLEDPHLKARDFFQPLEHAETGTQLHHGPFWKMSKTPNRLRLPPCRLGEHNEYVYKELLGLPEEEYARLEAEGHIGMDFVEGVP